MIIIREMNIDKYGINQKFEFGDLTIFIGRSNSGKTRILKTIFEKAVHLSEIFSREKSAEGVKREIDRIGIDIMMYNPLVPHFIVSPRLPKATIDGFTSGMNRIEESAKIIDETIKNIGSSKIRQLDASRSLDQQGSGMQNIIQILSESDHDNNFLLIDEPEISQSSLGKIEMIRRILELLKEKQVIVATHDPTIINQYLIKKLLNNEKSRIIIYSYCGSKFERVDFDSNLDPEVHCGYLSQTFSGKPVHLVVEGQTEFYAMQALIHKYCIDKEIPHFAKIVNKIGLSYMAGDQWKINVHHLPPPKYYSVLVVLDGEHRDNISRYRFSNNFKIINNFDELQDGKINILCLKSNKIEKAFNGILSSPEDISKPLELSDRIWKSKESIINKLENSNSEESKQIFDIIKWAVSKAS